MDDFLRQLSRLRKDRAFAAAFDKRRAQAEVAFQIRRLREAKGWTQGQLAEGGPTRPFGAIHARVPAQHQGAGT